jgi:hypothetical protein
MINVLEGTGLQFATVVAAPDRLDKATRSVETLFAPTAGTGHKEPAAFFPYLVTPFKKENETLLDAYGNAVPEERVFRIPGQDVLDTFAGKWLPIPYTLRLDGHREVDSNNWVRLWYDLQPTDSLGSFLDPRFVLCVDTATAHHPANVDFSPFLIANLGKAFALSPLSESFWRSTPMKGWIKKIGRNIAPADEQRDHYPAFSHYIALLRILEACELLPTITVSRALGATYDAHLFIDIGNSRTCGIVAETLTGRKPGAGNFEKLAIRNYYRPYEVFSEPFPTTLAFIPSPFDAGFNPDMDWSPNFRILSPLRVGHAVVAATAGVYTEPTPGPCSMSSPKRYLWSTDPVEAPWYFAMTDTSGASCLLKGDLLQTMDEAGEPKDWAQRLVPLEPRYPRSSMMTFFMVEILGHVMSQINSVSYRNSKKHPGNRRMLKSVVVTTPNGMVPIERDIYRKRIEAAIEFYWQFHGLAQDDRPRVYVGDYDEATCAQLVYLYSSIQDKFMGDGDSFFEHFGRRRSAGGHAGRFPSMRIAGIDIGGGTSDLMICDHMDTVPGPMTFLNSRALFQEGISVAGDELVRRIVSELILPQVVANSLHVFGREITMDTVREIFGPVPPDRTPGFKLQRRALIDELLVPMAYRFLEHARNTDEDVEISVPFQDMFRTQPSYRILEFLGECIAKVSGEPFVNVAFDGSLWRINRNKTNKAVMTTLAPVLRIFSQVIEQYGCDLVVLAGRVAALPVVRDMMVAYCPTPPSRVISLAGFPAGSWYPFDVKQGRIHDAKTTVAVGAALWFFMEELNAMTNFGMASHRDRLGSSPLFIGVLAGQKMDREDVLFPVQSAGLRYLQLAARTFLGSRRIDADSGHANCLYEVALADGTQSDSLPLSVSLAQNRKEQSDLSVMRVADKKGAMAPSRSVQLKLRTMEETEFWLDSGKIWG